MISFVYCFAYLVILAEVEAALLFAAAASVVNGVVVVVVVAVVAGIEEEDIAGEALVAADEFIIMAVADASNCGGIPNAFCSCISTMRCCSSGVWIPEDLACCRIMYRMTISAIRIRSVSKICT